MPTNPAVASQESLEEYIASAHARWIETVSALPKDSPFRFPSGHYEMGFALVGANPISSLSELKSRLTAALPERPTGLELFYQSPDIWPPYPFDTFIESKAGYPTAGTRGASDIAAFWRASLDGKMYALRGYLEDTKLGSSSQQQIETGLSVSL